MGIQPALKVSNGNIQQAVGIHIIHILKVDVIDDLPDLLLPLVLLGWRQAEFTGRIIKEHPYKQAKNHSQAK